jgi:hypothetical protein
VGADSPRHSAKRPKAGETSEEKGKPLKRIPKKSSKNDAKEGEKPEKSADNENTLDNKHNEESSEKENYKQLQKRFEDLEKVVKKLQAEIEILQKCRREPVVAPEPVKIVNVEAKAHEKRLQEIEKQLRNVKISSNKESAADTAFRVKFKHIIEKEFSLQEYGEQNVEIRARNRTGAPLLLAKKIQGVIYGDGGPYIECNAEDVEIQNLPKIENRVYFNLLTTADGAVRAYSQKRAVRDRPNPPVEARYRDARNRQEG